MPSSACPLARKTANCKNNKANDVMLKAAIKPLTNL